jgi:hypothetical protein
VAYRDFTCNAIYYDPVNEVIIDPSGYGVSDCQAHALRLVHGVHDRHQMAQVFIRAVKFMTRGFNPVEETRDVLLSDYQPMLAVLTGEFRLRYFETQVMSKHRALDDKRRAVAEFKSILENLGCPEAWLNYFDGIEESL